MTWELPEPAELARVARQLLASIMGAFACGVAIVTTRDSDGNPVGLTSTAVASISGEPPLLVVSIALQI